MPTSLPIPAALRPWVPLVTIVLCAFAFDRLFYDLAIGLNLLLFVVLVLGLLLQRIGWKQFSAPARATTLGTLLAATMVVVHNSGISIFMTIVSLGTCTALVHEPKLRSSFFTMAQLVSNYITLPLAAWQGSSDLMPQRGAARAGWRWGRLAVLPLLVGIVFFQLYRVGNPKFDALTAGFLDGLWVVFGDFIEFFFTPRLFFFLFAMFVCGGLLYRFAPRLVLQIEEDLSERLERVRTKRPSWMAPRSMNPLERERRMGLVLLVMVNALLLVVNIIDINWVWFGFEVPEGFSLKQFVHEGTWILIVSILLSMLILLHLFRRNQNFYSRSALLKTLGLVWVAQNLVLGISVFLRNYHYIDFHGLAYLRIGVIVFLMLVLVGLITLYISIRHQRSFFYLARVNGWAAFAVLIAMTTVDWDRFIVRTNLQHKNPGEIDIDNYLALSDRVLPLVYANIELVELQMARHRTNRVRWVDHLEPEGFRAALDAKRDRFLERYNGQRWQEENWADERTIRELRANEALHEAVKDLRYIRRWIVFFMVALSLSGLTAVPLEWLTGLLAEWMLPFGDPLHAWAQHAANAVAHIAGTYPILFYGTDWLAFAHIVIALAFIGPYRDPVRNKWVIEWGLWCCLLVLPLAFFWAPFRGIPFFWRCVDASFGVLGAIPLWLVLKRINKLEVARTV